MTDLEKLKNAKHALQTALRRDNLLTTIHHALRDKTPEPLTGALLQLVHDHKDDPQTAKIVHATFKTLTKRAQPKWFDANDNTHQYAHDLMITAFTLLAHNPHSPLKNEFISAMYAGAYHLANRASQHGGQFNKVLDLAVRPETHPSNTPEIAASVQDTLHLMAVRTLESLYDRNDIVAARHSLQLFDYQNGVQNMHETFSTRIEIWMLKQQRAHGLTINARSFLRAAPKLA